jgi:acyl-CoA synthetase (AMP-forming)/AMP-acid ligase II
LARHWSARYRLVNSYGPTETTITAAVYECKADQQGLVPIGRPLANVQIYLLDAYLQPTVPGVVGEIYIGGAGVARGYLHRPELTAERFLDDPFSAAPGARLYKTGDLGRWLADGNIAFHGRNDNQVKIRGFRIELGEVEAALSACSSVREAVVVAKDDKSGNKRLIAYLSAVQNAEIVVADVRRELQSTLPNHMVPALFVVVEAFALTANGKIDRDKLPSPDAQALVSLQYRAPQGQTESVLAHIWEELLSIEKIGRDDH